MCLVLFHGSLVSWFLFFCFTSSMSGAFGSHAWEVTKQSPRDVFLKSNVLFMLTIISRGDWLWFIEWCCSLSYWPNTIFCFCFINVCPTYCAFHKHANSKVQKLPSQLRSQATNLETWAFLLFSHLKMIGMLFNVLTLRGEDYQHQK